ncbi:MAG TPA: calcium-binding protein [Solirubrobacteraceae bacterium]|nr:calcium-binding protein [Solirubrobacteraceae bacterium]
MGKRTASWSVTALWAAIALALSAAPAAASTTVSYDGSRVLIAGDGAADDVVLAYALFGTGQASQSGVRVANSAGVVPGPGCVPDGTAAVRCPTGVGGIDATLGGGNDELSLEGYLDYVRIDAEGQAGNDDLTGSYDGTLDGGDGDDTLRPDGYGDQRVVGGGGSDTAAFAGYEAYATVGADTATDYGTRVDADVERLQGGSGYDIFIVGPNAGVHEFRGGPGEDIVSYSPVAAPMRVTLDGQANDGPSGRDHLHGDVEGAVGGQGDDEIVGGPGANVLGGGGGSDRISGGEGNSADELFGADGDDALEGGGGNDLLYGGTGSDRLEGGPGGDELAGGPEGDVLRGGSESDLVAYTDAVGPVTVTLDDRADDGAGGENDDVGSDVERVLGGYGDDRLVGSAGDNELDGGLGDDRIDGGDGADKIEGNYGDDIVDGGAGGDELRGGGGDDTLTGGPGEDFVIGQERENARSDDEEGLDVIELRDGERDSAACPAGIARVLADQHDLVAPSCPLVERFTVEPPPVGGPVPPPPPVGPSPVVRVHARGSVVSRRGIARLRVSCAPAPVPCEGVLSLFASRRGKTKILGKRIFAVPAATTRTIQVRLNERGRRMLRARRSVRVQIFTQARGEGARPIRLGALALRRVRR